MDPKERFSDRAEDYSKYRPRYPETLGAWLGERLGPDPSWVVADVGSGTGLFSELLLAQGLSVLGIEPNAAMRTVAEGRLSGNPLFRSLDGEAGNLPVADGSVSLVTAAQAFHWFDAKAFKQECLRVLKPPGWVLLVWNVRQTSGEGFLGDYERVMKTHASDYTTSGHRGEGEDAIEAFFEHGFEERVFRNPQFLFWEEVLGRAKSASYFPNPGQPQYDVAVEALRDAFDRHRQGGRVDFDYALEAFLGQLKP